MPKAAILFRARLEKKNCECATNYAMTKEQSIIGRFVTYILFGIGKWGHDLEPYKGLKEV